MLRPQSLALYKNRPVLVVEVKEKIEIRLEDGSSLRVRDKDLGPLHEGPVKAIPSAVEGGDFDTARRMLQAGSSLPWAELAELVFGASGPEEVLACWAEAANGLLFRLEDGLPQPLDDETVAKEEQKRARKEGEAAERGAFLERARRLKARYRTKEAAPKEEEAQPGFIESDQRFLSEIEALAYGKSAKSKTCAELGITESPEAAQAFLLSVGYWDETVNPQPQRAGCPLSAPRIGLGPEVDDYPRTDLGGMLAWAIDNAWSKDPDDAISWDGSSVWVHVADPASSIFPDSAVDLEALARGSTLYLPELTAPMLPDEALERYCLGFGQIGPLVADRSDLAVSHFSPQRETAHFSRPLVADRSDRSPAISFRIEVAEDGSIAQVEAMTSIVRVRRCSYGEADSLMAADQAPELLALASIADKRKRRRLANGAVEIDIPEVRIAVEGEGPTREIRIESLPHDSSSGLVREMMLLAGEAAARWAFERDLAFPFYGQEAPSDPGSSVLGDSDEEGGGGLAAQFARRRRMRAGMWGPSPSAHRGLGLPFYAQVTSPLRRYQDLLGHMQLRSFLARESGGAGGSAGAARAFLDADEVSRRCALAQAASAATRQAERASVLHWTLAYLLRHPQWTGEAVIVGGAGSGACQLYIPELGLETRARLGPGRALDERVRLRLARVDLAGLESSFEET